MDTPLGATLATVLFLLAVFFWIIGDGGLENDNKE